MLQIEFADSHAAAEHDSNRFAITADKRERTAWLKVYVQDE